MRQHPMVEGPRTQPVRLCTSPFIYISAPDGGCFSRDHHVDAPPSLSDRRRDTQLPPGAVPHQLVREWQREAVEIPQRREGALDRGYRLGVCLVVQVAHRIW
jgi:hypothetical protein